MADALLKKLRRLEGNMTCPNCGTEASRGIGFGHVCVKYKTFICDMCKASHQAISHRVKSVSMSTWTLDEVEELKPEHGGGNDACRQTILAGAPPVGEKYNGGCRPKQGDKIDFFKQFVMDAYEYGKFAESVPASSSRAEAPTQSHQQQPAFASSPAVDLLGGPVGGSGSFDAFGSSGNGSNGGSSSNFDPFGGSSNDAFAPSVPTSQGFDAFIAGGGGGGGGFEATTASSFSDVPAKSQAFDPFSSGASTSSNTVFASSNASSDPFASAPPLLTSQPGTTSMGAPQSAPSLQPVFNAIGAAPPIMQQAQRSAVMMGGPHQLPQRQAFVPSAPGSSPMGAMQPPPMMGGGPMGGGPMGGGPMGGGPMGGGPMGGGPTGGMQPPPQPGMGLGMMGGPMGGIQSPPQSGMGMSSSMGMSMTQGGIQQGRGLGGGPSSMPRPKTGMFSPGGAAVKPTTSLLSSTVSSNSGSSIMETDLAASLASTFNAKNGGNNQNDRGSARSDHHFDFIKMK